MQMFIEIFLVYSFVYFVIICLVLPFLASALPPQIDPFVAF